MNVLILFTLLIYFNQHATSQDRKITAVINPGCGSECGKAFLVYIQAESDRDILHHIWDFTNKPSVSVALTPKNTNISIDWERFVEDDKEGSVNFTTQPSYMFSIIFNKIIQFNDVNDTGILNENVTSNDYISFTDISNFNWTLVRLEKTPRVTAIVEGINITENYAQSPSNTGKVRIMLTAFGTTEHDSLLPHLFHTTNATQIDVAFEGIPTSEPQSRFGVNLLMASIDTNSSTVIARDYKSLDDEHSPGIFKVSEILSRNSKLDDPVGYLQWKTVSYTSPERSMANSTSIHRYSVLKENVSLFRDTLMYCVFGNELENMSLNSFNVSFGAKEDGFYRKTKYLSWTLLSGVGHPAEEEFSLAVILVVAIGLSIPLALIVVGIFCMIFRRLTRNSDDLFLSH